jgi:hypothetical protein
VSYITERRKIKIDKDCIKDYRALTLVYALLTPSPFVGLCPSSKNLKKKKNAFRNQSRLPKHRDLF